MTFLYKSSLLTFGAFSSKIISYVLSYLVAYKFGVSQQSDIILFFFSLPDLIITLLLANSVEVIISPYFNTEVKGNQLAAIIQKFLPIVLIIIIIFIVFKDNIFNFLAPGFSSRLATVSILDIITLGLALGMLPIIKVIKTYNNVKMKLVYTSFEIVIFNLVLLGVLFVSDVSASTTIRILFLAMLLRLAFTLWPNKRSILDKAKENISIYSKKNFTTVWHCVLLSALTVALPALIKAKASMLGDGFFSLISYTIKLAEFPIGIWGLLSVTILIPRLSRFQETNKEVVKWIILSLLFGSISIAGIKLFAWLVEHYPVSIKNLSSEQVKSIFSYLLTLSPGIFVRFPTIVIQLYLLVNKKNYILLICQITVWLSVWILYVNSSFHRIENNIVFMNTIYVLNFVFFMLAYIYDRKNSIHNTWRRLLVR